MPDDSTLEDCARILSRYELPAKLPAAYRSVWAAGPAETPKPGERYFGQSRYYCLLSNRDGVRILQQLARAQGWLVCADTSCDDWDYRRAADYLLGRLATLRAENPATPVAVVSGGELSCAVTGDGLGGRNQAFVLDCVAKIADERIIVLSGGTDGVDGNSPACGAVADGGTLARARVAGLEPEDFLRRSDAYHFFERLGDALIVGPTGTNVRDLRILLAYPQA
jgi:hydroxypyruvate reductase